MIETLQLSEILLPELERELTLTRCALESLPDEGMHGFKPHEKSMLFDKLAGHVAEMPHFASICLVDPPLDLALPMEYKSPKFESKAQLLSVFDKMAAKAVADLKALTNESLAEPWKLSAGPHTIFEGNRYNAYRTLALNHMVHHRAQLGVYLRLNNHPVPATYGPSADHP
jgi:hypothetical protein